LTLGEGTNTVRDTVRDLVAKGNRKLVLNLAGITHMDSAGIGELVTGFTTAATSGGRLKLLGLTKKVRELLQITKLYPVFEVFDDEAVAVRSFA
jgi:anti-sigma B factor antagonist